MSAKRSVQISNESDRAEELKQQAEAYLAAAENSESAEYAGLAEELPNIGKAMQILTMIEDGQVADNDIPLHLQAVNHLLDTAQTALDEFRESDIMNEFEYGNEFYNAFCNDDETDDEDEYGSGFGYQNEYGEDEE